MGTMRLPVPLTDEEKMGLAEDISAALTALKAAEDEKKAADSAFNAKIKTQESRIHELNGSFKTGSIDREVEVQERPNYTDGIMETVRLDTQVVVSTRTMDPEQRQMGLELSGLPEPTADVQDEQREAETPEEAEEIREARIAQETQERIDEIARLSAEQAKDEASTKKRTLLKAPPRKKKPAAIVDGKELSDEELNAAAGDTPTPRPVEEPKKPEDEEGLAF